MRSESYELLTPSDAVSAADSIENTRASKTTQFSHRALDDADNKDVLRKHHGVVHIWANWKWEILAYILVLGTPFFMVATIYPHAGQPLPQWPFRITINALLSIYSVVLKASLGFLVASCLGQLQWNWFASRRALYDVVLYSHATQSAWGSLRWIWWHHMEQPLATVGCTILILSIALDPFIQQLVRPIDCEVVVHGQARLPRTNVNYGGPLGHVGTARDLVRALQRAGISSSSDINVDCPTGNCTFSETYGTLGYCSHCEDSSADLTRRFICSPDDGHDPSLPPTSSSDCPEKSNWTKISSLPESWRPVSWLNNTLSFSSLNVTLTEPAWIYEYDDPDGIEVATISVVFNDSEKSRPEQIMVQIIVAEHPVIAEISNGQDLSFWEDFWGTANCGGTNATTWRCRGYGAATCSLSPCVRFYNATVENGRLTERLVDNSGGVLWGETWGESGLALLDTACLSSEEIDIVRKFHVNIDPGQRWAWLESVPHLTGKPSQGYTSATWIQKLFERKCLYFIIDDFARREVPLALGPYLSGSLRATGDQMPMFFHGDVVLENMHDYGRIDMERIESTMSNISEALTRFMRTNGHANYSADALGQVKHYATCIEAQWFWILLPGVLALMTLVILVLVIATANAQHKPVWKGSPLVWIIRGVDGYEPGRHHLDLLGAPTLADLEKTSKQTIISVT